MCSGFYVWRKFETEIDIYVGKVTHGQRWFEHLLNIQVIQMICVQPLSTIVGDGVFQ